MGRWVGGWVGGCGRGVGGWTMGGCVGCGWVGGCFSLKPWTFTWSCWHSGGRTTSVTKKCVREVTFGGLPRKKRNRRDACYYSPLNIVFVVLSFHVPSQRRLALWQDRNAVFSAAAAEKGQNTRTERRALPFLRYMPWKYVIPNP